MFIEKFHADFNESLFVSIALALMKAFMNFHHGGLSHEIDSRWKLTDHHDVTRKNEVLIPSRIAGWTARSRPIDVGADMENSTPRD